MNITVVRKESDRNLKIVFTYLLEREQEQGESRGSGRDRESQADPVLSAKPDVGLSLTDPEITT